ncbi:MAG: hypothetical protein JRJ45_00020 [Deltaproteobacteria bacterium]|nr:hypothetical protein [Deltaproteobacteria bacterium]
MRAPHENICRDPMTMLVIGMGAMSAFGSISAGFAQQDALEKQADQQRDQARLAAVEAEEEAVRREEQRDRMLATQRVAFAANGIRVTPGAGSVLAVLEDTTRQFNMEIAAVRRRGTAETKFGFTEAVISENKGRAAVLSGFTQAAGTAAQTAGVFA